jgi:hypothetical protein
MDLAVLVWGPGDPGPNGNPLLLRYWQKRNQIKKQLEQVFPNSEVRFSEDPELREATRGFLTPIDEELVQASSADCILVLDVSRGAHVEVDRFSEYPNIAASMVVFIPEEHVGGTGLVSHVHSRLQVVGFSERDFAQCRVATEIAVAAVEARANDKLLGPVWQR